ncbi:MAG: transglutaminase domain-containing protein [Bacteroidales bacterium]|jgi:hypothetical protein|nr:transglutaminase domain-containing protein [Bacteroidales bacterium]
MQTRFINLLTITVLLINGLLFQSCLKSKRPGIPAEVVKSISETGFNRIELTKTIAHYIDQDDSLYLQSAYFLIQHLPHQYAVKYKMTNDHDSTLNFDPKQFDSFQAQQNWWYDQKYNKNGIRYKAKKYSLDKDTITAELLINTINLAIMSRSYPWTTAYSIDDFFEYVLPYRFGNESLHDWRTSILENFSWMIDSLDNQTDPSELIDFIDLYVDNHFSFDKRYLRIPEPQCLEEILQSKTGNYQDIAYLKAMLLRSFGIPSTIDYIPFLADTTGSFYFTVAMNSDGIFEALLPLNTEYLFKQNKIPKVYRRIYSKNPKSLFSLKELSLSTPPFIGHYHYQDVTKDYVATLPVEFKVKNSDTLYYTAVYNDSMWRAVDWAITKNQQIIFPDLGQNISYRIMVVVSDSLVFE